MGKADVEQWVFASTIAPEGSDNAGTDEWDKNRVLADWTNGVQIVQTNLSSSSTKTRTDFLEGLVVPLVKDESESSGPKLTAITRLKFWKI